MNAADLIDTLLARPQARWFRDTASGGSALATGVVVATNELQALQAALAARQPVESEENVAADTYWTLAEMIEPHVQREGINPDGVLPASVHDSVAILLEHWLRTRQPVGKPVAYLDLGAGGYMDLGTDLSDEELAALPKGRHMLGIIGTYGVDGYKPAQAVDLGQFRPFIVEARNNAYAFIETMRKAGRDSSDAREKAATTERPLALIDSQAVGK